MQREEETKISNLSTQHKSSSSSAYVASQYDANKEYPLHELAEPSGGMQLSDPGNLVPDALKALLYKSGK